MPGGTNLELDGRCPNGRHPGDRVPRHADGNVSCQLVCGSGDGNRPDLRQLDRAVHRRRDTHRLQPSRSRRTQGRSWWFASPWLVLKHRGYLLAPVVVGELLGV